MLIYILLVLLYLLPLGLINLNSITSAINDKRNKSEVDVGFVCISVFFSVIPIVNLLTVLIVPFACKDDLFLTQYLKQLNYTVKCSSCKIVTRVHYLKSVRIKEVYYSKVVDFKDECPFCECTGSMYIDKHFMKKDLPFGKKINWLYGIIHFFSQGMDKTERKLHSLKKKQSELEFIDHQLEHYAKIQEKKLDKYMAHAERIRSEYIKQN